MASYADTKDSTLAALEVTKSLKDHQLGMFMEIDRRKFIQGFTGATTALAAAPAFLPASARGANDRPAASLVAADVHRIPFIQTTDLFHPPADPDDHIDLATVLALDELDIRAVLLDRALGSQAGPGAPDREPGFVPVAQLCYLTGKAMPVAAGPVDPLQSPADSATDRPRREQAAVDLMLRVLRESSEPVAVSVLGSARILVAAYNRDPALLRQKVRSVILNAGSSGDDAKEYNVRIDVPAYVGLFRSGLPLDWYPCGAPGPSPSVANNADARNTFWRVARADLFRDLPQPLLAWFIHAFSGNGRGDILRALREQGRGASAAVVSQGNRAMWSTASLVMAAGRVLAKTNDGWRFLAAGQVPPGARTVLLGLEPVNVTISDDGRTRWEPSQGSSKIRLFRRDPGPEHDAAMGEATNALLRSIPIDPP
jgi:hypothetical protein